MSRETDLPRRADDLAGDDLQAEESLDLHRRQDSRLEGLEVLANELRGEVRDMRNELSEVHGAAIRIESCMLSMAPRLRRLDRERELDREDIRAIRAEQRQTDSLPDFESLSPTGKVRALNERDAAKLIANAAKDARLAALEKQLADQSETATAWRRLLVPVIITAFLAAAGMYAVTELTKPRYKQTTEQK